MQGKMESFNVLNQGYGRKRTLFWKISLVAVKMWEQGRLEAGQLGHICAEHLLFVSTDLPYNLTCSLRLNWLWVTSTVFPYPLASVGFDQHSLGDQRERLRVIIQLDSFLQGLCALTKVLASLECLLFMILSLLGSANLLLSSPLDNSSDAISLGSCNP